MKFNELIEDLALGYLSSTSLVDGNEIAKDKLPQLIQILNRSLEHFYTTFVLKESTVIIRLVGGISHYYLNSDYAISIKESSIRHKYIMDSDLIPFTDTVIQIHLISTLDGRNLSINDIHSSFGVMLPEYNCIHIPYDLGVEYLSVTYQSGHERIPLTEPAISKRDIKIPVPFITAFMNYVACVFMQGMGGEKHGESGAYFAAYSKQVELLKEQGIGVKSYTGNNIKPMIRGWR